VAQPVLLHIPHASLEIPPDLLPTFLIAEDDLQRELIKMTDAYTDQLFHLPNADRLVFPISRLVVDPERFREDADEPMSSRGMGAVYTRTHDGRPLKNVPNREALLRRYYDPHHEALGRWAREAVEEHGSALIVDCHSFPSEPLACDMSQERPRPDMNIGTDPFHTPHELAPRLKEAMEAEGWTVGIDWPYAGTMVPTWAFGKDARVRSVMVEVRRGLYMDERTGERLPTFDAVKRCLSSALQESLPST
jgi:N-formylglutamate amidohydrolase